MKHPIGTLPPETIADVLDHAKAFILTLGFPLRPLTVAAITRDYLNAEVVARLAAAERRKAREV